MSCGKELELLVSCVGYLSEAENCNREKNSEAVGNLILSSRKVLCEILKTKCIPHKKRKEIFQYMRVIISAQRVPYNPRSWLYRNKDKILLLADAYTTWPLKQNNSDDLFQIGNFNVHNVLGLMGLELETFKGDVAKVHLLVCESGIPGLSKILYGDLFLLPLFKQTDKKGATLGSYVPNRDFIFTRHSRDIPMEEVQVLLHELGHRFWQKFAEPHKKEAWIKFYEDTLAKSQRIVLPKIGDICKLRNGGLQPLTKIIDGVCYFKHPDPTLISTAPIERIVATRRANAKAKAFCTSYAATNPEECFCETLAAFCMGELTPEQEKAFREIWF